MRFPNELSQDQYLHTRIHLRRRLSAFARMCRGIHKPVLAALAVAIFLCASLSAKGDDEEGEFAEAHLFFELNNTDGDLGIHALIDGDPWKRLHIEDTNERKVLNIRVLGRLRQQGLTEIFFESAEPTFDELSAEEFFARFPEGDYEITGITLEGEELESEIDLSHVMPSPPQPWVNGVPFAQQCDDEEPGYDAPEVATPVTISWPQVTISHPDPDGGGAGVQPPVGVMIHNYEVVVEAEFDVNGEEFASTTHIILPPGVTSVTLPEEFIGQADEFKYEVLARETNYNQTATESCFLLAE